MSAPFQPPKSRVFELFGLIQQLKNQQQEEARSQLHEQRAQEQMAMQRQQYAREAQKEDTNRGMKLIEANRNINLDKVSQQFPFADLTFLKEVQRGLRDQEKRAEATGFATERIGRAAQESLLNPKAADDIRMKALTDLQGLRFGAQGYTAPATEDISTDARALDAALESARVGEATAQRERDIAFRQEVRSRGEQRGYEEEQFSIESIAKSVSILEAMGETIDPAAFSQYVQEQGYAPQQADRIVREGIGRGRTRTAAERASLASAQGLTDTARDAQWYRDDFTQRYGADELNRIGIGQHEFDGLAMGKLYESPLGTYHGVPILNRAVSKVAAQKAVTAETEIIRLHETFERDLMPAYEGLARAYESGEVDRIPFANREFYDLLSKGGFDYAPQIASYLSSSLIYPSFLLKSIQGSRPSDFDFRIYLSLAPYVSEVGQPTGNAKIGLLRNMVNGMVTAPMDPASRKEWDAHVGRLKAQSYSASDNRFKSTVQPILDMADQQGRALTPDEQQVVGGAVLEWQRENVAESDRYKQFLPNGVLDSIESTETPAMRRVREKMGQR